MSSNAGINQFKDDAAKSQSNVVHFFSPIDKGSSMPCWYYQKQVEEEEDWVGKHERQLRENLIPTENIRSVKDELKKRKARLDAIRHAEEKIRKMVEDKKDEFSRRWKELGKTIADSMFTRDEMFHKPSRSVDPRHEAERGEARNHIVKEWKCIGRILGEDTNVERLRKGK